MFSSFLQEQIWCFLRNQATSQGLKDIKKKFEKKIIKKLVLKLVFVCFLLSTLICVGLTRKKLTKYIYIYIYKYLKIYIYIYLFCAIICTCQEFQCNVFLFIANQTRSNFLQSILIGINLSLKYVKFPNHFTVNNAFGNCAVVLCASPDFLVNLKKEGLLDQWSHQHQKG